ncbi:MAG: epoxyqueuosine reductase [Clostridium sp.]|nr:epoxyqueuosine reductase [Clostridium sp.]
MEDVEASLKKLFKTMPEVIYGFSNISFSEFKKHYKCALVFFIPHEKILTLDNYKEQLLEDIIGQARNKVDLLIPELEKVLKEHSIKHYVPPVAQSSEETLLAPFSFKFAAVNAGLGWIGKNSLFITEKYGPRGRLGAVLIDYDFKTGNIVSDSLCKDNCNRCVAICPYKALHGVKWNINKKRAELIDYKLCNQRRSLYIKDHGRKNSCGLCLVSCPYGVK